MIILIDDGTLDTVLRCEECGEEFTFSTDPSRIFVFEQDYLLWVEDCKQKVIDDHECFPLDLEAELEEYFAGDEDLYFEDTESVPDATGTSEGLRGTEGQDREAYSDTQDRESYLPDEEDDDEKDR